MATKDVADILLIGSGASGGPFAWYLSQVKGIKVVCLEQGDWVGKEIDDQVSPDRPGTSSRDEQYQRLVKTAGQPGVNYFRNGYPYDHTESYWEPVLGHNVGGATVHYGGGWARLRMSDFVVKSTTGMAEDWPIRYTDLAPFWDLNDNKVGVVGRPGNPAYPNRNVKLLPVPGGDARPKDIFSAAADKLGWHHFSSERAIISVPFNGRDPKNYREAKNRADVVHWPEAIKNGVVLKTRATVREITVNKQGLADGATYYDAEGRLHEQKARLVVVACNAIGTARLLLNSKSSRFPTGLANRSGLVGKGLMGHPLARVLAEFESDVLSGASGNGVNVDEFYDIKLRGDAYGGFTFGAGGYGGPVAAAIGTPPESLFTMIPASLEQGPRRTGNALAWGRAHHAAFLQRTRRIVSSLIICSELPENENRVELHPTLTDDFGTPAPKLIYKRSENTVKLMAYAMDRAREFFQAAGASDVTADYDVKSAGRGAAPGHYMGTARMGNDPERSVVDKWGRAHDVKNLYVIDGGVFVTSGSNLPTSTIQAIALRTADYIKTNAKQVLST